MASTRPVIETGRSLPPTPCRPLNATGFIEAASTPPASRWEQGGVMFGSEDRKSDTQPISRHRHRCWLGTSRYGL